MNNARYIGASSYAPAQPQRAPQYPEPGYVSVVPVETKTLDATPATRTVARAKLPASLMKMSRKSTQPVRRKNVVPRGKGWRSITAGDAVNYGVKAWNLAKHIATLINVEEKVFDVDGSAGIEITSTPLVVNLSNIAQGSDYFNRIGDSILLQSIEFRARMLSSAGTASDTVRVLLVRDKLQRGTDPTLGDVLQGGTSPVVQPYLEPQDQRFDILYDHVEDVNTLGAGLATGGTSTTYSQSRRSLPSLVRKINTHIKYQGSSAADGSNWIGGLYLMAVSLTATPNGPVMYYTCRLRFTDN